MGMSEAKYSVSPSNAFFEVSKTAALDITIKCSKDADDFDFKLFNADFTVKPRGNLFIIGEHKVPLSRTGGDVDMRILYDTTSMECFFDDGLIYAPFVSIMDKEACHLVCDSESAWITVKELKNIHE